MLIKVALISDWVYLKLCEILEKIVLIFKCLYEKFFQNLYESKNAFLTIKLDIKSKAL